MSILKKNITKRGNVNIISSNHTSKKYFIGFIIISFFIISVFVRVPNINRPLSYHHEWLTSTVLRTQQIWYEKSDLTHRFFPIMTYDKKSDRNINNQARIKDAEGNFYYTSYPPFAYIFPYLIFQLFNIYPDVLPIQIFNIIIHFICSFFIFLIISLLTNKYYINKVNIPALFGFAIYLFSPAPLWFHSNVYMSDMLVQPFFIIGIYMFLKIIKNEGKLIYCVLLGIINFFMIYTEWLGVFFAFAVFIFALFNMKEKSMRTVIIYITISSVASLSLTIWHYSQISGLDALIKSSMEKYLYRSGFSQYSAIGLHYGNLTSWKNIVSHYYHSYLPFFIILCIVVFMYLSVLKKCPTRDILHRNKIEATSLYLCIVPVLIHHLIFFNFTSIHDFSVLKTGVFISIFTSLIYSRLVNAFYKDISDKAKILKVGIINSIIILMAILSVCIYQADVIGDDTSFYKEIGQIIASNVNDNEVVFVKTDDFCIDPQIVFYAHRNIDQWKNESKARELLNLNEAECGVVFIFDIKNKQISKEYIY